MSPPSIRLSGGLHLGPETSKIEDSIISASELFNIIHGVSWCQVGGKTILYTLA